MSYLHRAFPVKTFKQKNYVDDTILPEQDFTMSALSKTNRPYEYRNAASILPR